MKLHWEARHGASGRSAATGVNRQHKCSHCEAAFVRKSHLVKHVQTHFEHVKADGETSTRVCRENRLSSDNSRSDTEEMVSYFITQQFAQHNRCMLE